MAVVLLQIFTWVGMRQLAALGFFVPKKFLPLQLLPLAVGYVGYIVLGNLSLNLNNVGFYQVRLPEQCDEQSAPPLAGLAGMVSSRLMGRWAEEHEPVVCWPPAVHPADYEGCCGTHGDCA